MFGSRGGERGGNIRALLIDAIAKIRVAMHILETSDIEQNQNAVAVMAAMKEAVPKYLGQAEADINFVLEIERQIVAIFEQSEKEVESRLKAKLG